MTIILEEAINGVEGMRYMTSTSGNDGSSVITIVFELSRPLDIAAVDVQNRVSGVQGRLPNEVKTTGVTVNKVSTSFVMAAGFYSLNNRYDNEFISNYIDIYVKDALKRVHGRLRRADLRRAQVLHALVARSRAVWRPAD